MYSLFSTNIEKTDDQLLTLLQKGSEEAFTIIYGRYHTLLYVIAFNYLKDKPMAEDAVQQIFLRLWETRSALHIKINLKNYLFTMLKNHVLNEIRNHSTAIGKNYELAQQAPAWEDELLEKIEEKEMWDLFHEAINRLPEQKKQVCLLKLQGNLSNQEIAAQMSISVPTVKTHYALAIRILRADLDKKLFILLCFFLL